MYRIFSQRQRIVRLHGGMAGHGRRDAAERVFHARRRRSSPSRSSASARTAASLSDASSSAGTADRRRLPPPNSSTSRPNRSSVPRAAGAPDAARGDSSIRIGVSSRWLSRRPARQPLHHLLEQHALVRHVLIDDRHAFVVDRDDERVAELAERDHRANRGSLHRSSRIPDRDRASPIPHPASGVPRP